MPKFDPELFTARIQEETDAFRARAQKDRAEIERDLAEARAKVIKAWTPDTDK